MLRRSAPASDFSSDTTRISSPRRSGRDEPGPLRARGRPVGPYAVGFDVGQNGEGWYFSHGGSNWGFRASFVGHVRHGYGAVIMTNASQGSGVAAELRRRIERAYGWDSVAEPAPRGYRPS